MMTSSELNLPSQKTNQRTNYSLKTRKFLTFSRRTWYGAAVGLLIGLGLVLAISTAWMLRVGGPIRAVIGVIAALIVVAAAATLAALFISLLGKIPFLYRIGLAVALAVTALLGLMGVVYLIGIVVTMMALVIGFSLTGAGLDALIQKSHKRKYAITGLMLGCILILITGAWLVYPGTPIQLPSSATPGTAAGLLIDMPDPSQQGEFPVKSLCYGSAGGRQMPPCDGSPAIITQPVDGSPFVEGWSSLRTSYWGFSADAMPLNARVWYPEGQGPFPLVLIVHGNALMEKPSHGGYAYLGELLASRGFIVASIDQNFLNLSFFSDLFVFNGLKEENDARGWLLLEHLRVWHAWNNDSTTPFYGLINLNEIVLIGHSRGGEAIAAAAAFNRMPYYPDDARIAFDYGYSIRSLAAIAPVDGQYKPGGMPIPLEDINYLVLQGAHDMDVVHYMGARQYERVNFTGQDFYFKAGLYIDGANHGQFNTAWGRKDITEPLSFFFNLGQLMPGNEQRRISEVYLAAFLETTLHNQHGYLPLFRAASAGAQWLPEGVYLNQYADSDTLLINNYEEDADPSTTSLAGGSVQGHNLTVWHENIMPARYGSSENRVVYLGWRSEAALASYDISLPFDLATDQQSVLVFSMSGTYEDPCPDEACQKARTADYRPPEAFNLTVEVSDWEGNTARLDLSSRSILLSPLETRLAKAPFPMTLPQSEIVLQHYEFPIAAFVASNPAFNPRALSMVRLVFDRTPEGVIVLDHTGLRGE